MPEPLEISSAPAGSVGGGPVSTGHPSPDWQLRAALAKDQRFDGWFVTAVRTTGIYCRPSCPALRPRPENVVVLATAAAAQRAGFRACKRCRPDASPGSPQWDLRADTTGRAMRLIADGLLDRDGVTELAARVGYSPRQLQRHLLAEVGAGPVALARAQRAVNARTLLEGTTLSMSDVAHAAGFASVRSFNDTLRAVYATTPGELRRRAATLRPLTDRPGAAAQTTGTITVALPFRRPLCPGNLFGHLAATAVPGVEEWRDGAYRRTLRLPRGYGVVALTPGESAVSCRLQLSDLRDLATAVARCRRLLDLDADPVGIDEALSADPALAPLVARDPGRRVPRTVDPEELAVRAVLGQQVSTAAARTHAARLVQALGTPVADREGGLTHLFPTAAAIAAADPQDVGPQVLALPARRRATLLALSTALATGELDLSPGADPRAAARTMLALPGIGPWTVGTVAMRALGDPDAFLAGDLGLRSAAVAVGLPGRPADLEQASRAWSPWRSYAVQYLWGVLDHPVNRVPTS